MHEVRMADADDLAQLPAVEAAADELFVPLGITDLPPPASAAERAGAWRVLVAGRPVQGFAVLELLDGAVHLEQLSVHPASEPREHGLPAGARAELARRGGQGGPSGAVERALLRPTRLATGRPAQPRAAGPPAA